MRRPLSRVDLKRANLPKSFWHVKMQEVSLEVAKPVHHYLRTIEERVAQGEGLLLVGGPGTGKTGIAALVVKEAIANGFSAYFTTVWEMRDCIRDRERFDEDYSVTGRARTVDVLVLDDLTEADAREKWFGGPDITSLVRIRAAAKKVTVITTSEVLQSLKESYPGLMRRTSDSLATLVVRGPDKRAAQKDEFKKRVLGQ